ncbi:hypothetical protein G7009_03100 [Pseudomonas capeferrum]|uniref:hypothetical protein n=1 Tax=Pseudomonas capeferrum TaxID=1495066 RepID=UPI0015E2795C|nr:hypothetical protein [Pseudomonas capeferrum]MBA1200773.1 hypothetical protein [Pseudomonas capeferrum]
MNSFLLLLNALVLGAVVTLGVSDFSTSAGHLAKYAPNLQAQQAVMGSDQARMHSETSQRIAF